MRNKKFVQITVWVVVIAMVLSLAVAAISLF
jgi:archaellin